MAVEWGSVPYLPMISLRPAEMRALEELPNLTKDRLLPIVHLRPWVGSHRLESATARIADAYGKRRVIIAMGSRELSNDRPVHAQLDVLRRPEHGFREWCDFFETNVNYIPAMQFSPEVAQEEKQIARLFSLDRGLAVIIERQAFAGLRSISQRIGERSAGGLGVCFVIDFGIASRDHLQVAATAIGYINIIREAAPAAYVALSASSFPDSFSGVNDQPIYERRLFDTMPNRDLLIYSDRGSARVERQNGGGGQPNPRIDYPMFDKWGFYRSDDVFGFEGYRDQAIRLMKTESDGVWKPSLRVWGTQMIERTANGDTSAITSPQKATAARINIHLQLQTFFGQSAAAENTDEDWIG